jgi:hypothetical protein
MNSYLELHHDQALDRTLFRGLQDAPRMINAVSRVVVEPRESSMLPPLTLIPSYPDLPMEKVYPRGGGTNIAGVFLRETPVQEGAGSGRVAYFPMDLDRTFWEVLAEDHLKLMRNTLQWATREPQKVEVQGAGLLDVTAWLDHNAIVIHLVNLTNSMAMKGPYREFLPLGEQRVTVRLPEAMHAKAIHLLVAEKPAETHVRGHDVTIMVPAMLDHEIVAIDV